MKKVILGLIILTMLLSTTAYANVTISTYNPENRLTFSDVHQAHWAYKDVMIIANKGIIVGTTTAVNGVGTFNPNGNVTVGEFLAIATRLVAAEKIMDNREHTHWAAPNYMAAIFSGLITIQQFECTAEALDSPISREDMAMILVNMAKRNGERLLVKSEIEDAISDYESIDISKRDAVKMAFSNGLITGKDTTGKFAPKDTLTRAEAAAVFCRVMNYTERPEVRFTAYDDVKVLTGENAGLMRGDVATKYDLQALQSARFYKENGKLYVSIDLPQLPEDFKWGVDVTSYDSDGNYVFYMSNETINQKGHNVYEIISKYDDKSVNDIDTTTLSVVILNSENKSLVSHKLSTKAPNQVLRQSSLRSNDASWEDFDTSNIFGW